MTRVIKIQRKFLVKFERVTYQIGMVRLLADDEDAAEELFWLMEEEGDLANHRDYHLETFSIDEHEITNISPVETTQER